LATSNKTDSTADIREAIEPDQSLFKFTAISLIGTAIGIVVGSTLLYFLVIIGSSGQLTSTVYQAHAQEYASAIDHQLRSTQSQLNHFASQDQFISLVQGQQSLAIDSATNQMMLTAPHIKSIRFFLPGYFSSHADQSGLSYAQIDMANRAETGELVATEAHGPADSRILAFAQAVRNNNTDVIGSLVATYEMALLHESIKGYLESDGSMLLEQSAPQGRPQVLVMKGSELDDTRPIISQTTKNNGWTVKFQPSVELTRNNSLPAINFWLPVIAVLLISVASILFAYLKLRANVRVDAIALVNYCRELIVDDFANKPKFLLSLFHSMATTLEATDLEKTVEKNASKQEPSISAPADSDERLPAAEVELEEVVESELAEEDILDLDLVGLNNVSESPDLTLDAETENEEDQVDPDRPTLPDREIRQDIFRAYDIRGIVGDSLDTDIAYRIGQAIGSEAQLQGDQTVVVGADGRLSSPELSAALVQGLRDSGSDVVNIGMVPTPLVYYATNIMDTKSGVMITGSHNPADYNGFKIVIAGKTLANEEIQKLYQRIVGNDFSQGNGAIDNVDISENYLEQITNDIAIARNMKVVVDCGNGVAGDLAPRLLEALGCEVVPLYCEIDGRFPNHHPDPGKPENLVELIATVKEQKADLGIAFDGDGDRVGIVTNSGEIIYPDRLMMLIAKDVASRNPGADIIFDVKCSRRLPKLISLYGGRPIMSQTGHSLIKAKMQETGALLAGEMSGHIFFKERWYGFDDGLYSAARILEILALQGDDADMVFAGFPDDFSTPELNINVSEKSKFDIVEKLKSAADFDDAEISTIDGLRVDFEKGWGLVRASNTTPMLVLRFAGEDEITRDEIQQQFKQLLETVAPDLDIPF